MKKSILVLGGTKFFGIPMVEKLLLDGHQVTIATRGKTTDFFGDRIHRIKMDLIDYKDVREKLGGLEYDVVIDKIGYASNEMRAIMDAVSCEQFIHMSSSMVYDLKHMDIHEKEFNGEEGKVVWNDRMEQPYSVNKRRAEQVLFQYQGKARQEHRVAVRYPFVVGPKDYTGRLFFYADHVLNGRSMYIDNMDAKICYIDEISAGLFLAHLVGKNIDGAFNGCCVGTVSFSEMFQWIKAKTGKEPVLDPEGKAAPFNGVVSNSLNTEKAGKIGFYFPKAKDYIKNLLESYLI